MVQFLMTPSSGPKESKEHRDKRDEPESDRLDREYGELLQEMRVLQAGVQILFAFLLTLAFQTSFTHITNFERDVYLCTLIAATFAAALIIGPVPFHRVVFRRGMKEDLIKATTRYVAGGLTFLLVAMVGAVLLVLDVLLSRPVALITVSVIAVVFVLLWLVLPYLARAEEPDHEHDKPGR